MENLYQPPAADLELPVAQESPPFFVSSSLKLVVLYIVTFGWYSNYWFYKHWKTVQPGMNEEISPFARSFFYWFFVHALFDRIAEQQKTTAQQRWNYSGMASLVIVADILRHICERMSDRVDIENGSSETLLLGLAAGMLAFFLLPLWPMLAAQSRANVLAGDPSGSSNSHFSLYNMIFVALGIVGGGAGIWLMAET